ncbi:MAG TPA: ABC transporter substrate-binding protein [Gaiellaceae bacterium]|nr:ABC transporter substrate-binding protein [Gaiellaceae bacterium]
MKNRFWLSIVMATIGVALLVATAFAGAATSAPSAQSKADARGGTFRYDNINDFDYIDPSLAYFSHSWQLGAAVGLQLLGYADKEGAEGSRLRAEAATGLPTVSKDGKTYTFKIKQGFRFSNGTPVTSRNFAFAINRALNPKMQSPAASFVEDIAGAQAVLDGKAATASGVTTPNNQTLVVKLTKVAPDFLSRMTMEFFPAMPTNTPVEPEGVNAPMVSAGPYYVKEWVKGRSALAARNPYWNNNKEPWKSLARPANVDAISFTIGNSLDATKLRIDKNDTDYGGVPTSAYSGLVDQFGINKERFFIRKNMVFWYLALNNDSALFKGNLKLRQAVNWAIDRPQMVRQHGFLAGGRTDQILPPGMPGFKNWSIYPLGGVNNNSLNKAKGLAEGNLRGGKAVFYAFNSSFGPTVAQVVQFNLKQIGIDLEIKSFTRTVQHEKVGTRGEAFDISHSGWGADYADPSNFINVLLDGSRIQAANNVNESYFNDPKFNSAMAKAAALSGDARLQAYSNLDRDITKDGAPLASYINTNGRYYVSQSVGCFTVDPTHGVINLVAICKK